MSSDSHDRFKAEFGRLGRGLGRRLGRGFSPEGSEKAARAGEKLGGTFGGGLGKLNDALEKEQVTTTDQLGVGGKIGTGIGVAGKQFMERRASTSPYAQAAASADLASEGRKLGAKMEKILKRKVESGIKGVRERIRKK